MNVARSLRLTGKTKRDAIKALDKVKEYVTRRPEDLELFRYIHISLDVDNGENILISEGGFYGEDHSLKLDIDEAYKKAHEALDSNEIERYFISATINKDLE